MRFGSVCSGIEAASVAWHPLGWQAAWLAEIEPFPSALLAHQYPDTPNLGNMRDLPDRILFEEVEAPDVFCGGTPCQAFSVAGLRKSLDDPRGNLALVFCEIANAIDTIRTGRGDDPAIIFWENVPGVLNTKDNAFGCFLAGLAGESEPLEPPGGKWTNAGFVLGPKRAVAWRVLDAQYFGVAQRRRRVFVVASAREGFDPAAVLFEFEGVRRDSAPSRETGKGTSKTTARSVALRGRDGGATAELGDEVQNCLRASSGGGDKPHALVPDISQCITTGTGQRYDPETETILPHVSGVAIPHTDVMPTMTCGGGHAASHNQVSGQMRDQYLTPVCITGTLTATYGEQSGRDLAEMPGGIQCVTGDITHTLKAEGFDASEDGTGRGQPIIAFPANLSGTQCASAQDIAPSMGAANPTAVAFQERGRAGGSNLEIGGDVAYSLMAPSGGGRAQERNVLTPSMQVRRLTPIECERLQGFPDNYTLIPWRKKPAYECPDGPRYKALGNSWAVPNVRWIGRRIADAVFAA